MTPMNKINHLDFNRATTPLTSEGAVASCVAQPYCFYTNSFYTRQLLYQQLLYEEIDRIIQD